MTVDEQYTLFRIQVLTLFVNNTNCLLHRMYEIRVYFDITRDFLILEKSVLLITQIICYCKLDK
jgi:hypothetical protein